MLFMTNDKIKLKEINSFSFTGCGHTTELNRDLSLLKKNHAETRTDDIGCVVCNTK